MKTKKTKKESKEKKEPFEKEIVDRLENLERIVTEMRDSLTKIRESSLLNNEDQLFFSFVFSLALLAITIPSLDVGTLFEAYFGLKLDLPFQIIETKYLVVFLLIISSALRYLVSTGKRSLKDEKILRVWSVRVIVLAFYFLMFELLFRGMATFLGGINVFLLLVPSLILMSLSHFIGKYVERRWLRLYGYDDQDISVISFAIAFFVLATYSLSMVLSLVETISAPISPLAAIPLIIIPSLALMLVILRLYRRFLRTDGLNKRS